MNITEARRIADLVNNQRFKGFLPEIHTAFQRLHASAERGNKNDRALAKLLWDYVGEQDLGAIKRSEMLRTNADLLAALKEAVAQINCTVPLDWKNMNLEYPPVKEWEAAIAKAEGKTDD